MRSTPRAIDLPSTPNAAVPAVRGDWGTVGRLLPYLWRYRWRVGLALAFMVGAKLSNVGVPILLNTSFNENEPIVNTPANALDCFLRTKMDMLVLENYIVSR